MTTRILHKLLKLPRKKKDVEWYETEPEIIEDEHHPSQSYYRFRKLGEKG